MRIIFATLLLIAIPLFVRADITLEKELDNHIKSAVAAGQYQSLIIAYMQDGQTLIRAYGTLQVGSDAQPTIDTLFELSSNSKTFAGSLLALLAARGEISLDDPVNLYLPDGVKIATFNGVEVSLKHLATHRAGLPYTPADYVTQENDPSPYSDYTMTDLWKSVNAFKPTRESGSHYQYSAFGFGILSQALSQHMGLPYFDLLKKEILTPLKMTSTYVTVPINQRQRLAQGHLPNGTSTDLLMDQGALMAAGFMITNLNDLLKYMRAHMGESEISISSGLKLSHHTYTEEPTMGLGWENSDGTTNRFHYGTGQGHRAFIGFNKTDSKRRGVIVLTNTKYGTTDIGKHALNPNHKLPEIK